MMTVTSSLDCGSLHTHLVKSSISVGTTSRKNVILGPDAKKHAECAT